MSDDQTSVKDPDFGSFGPSRPIISDKAFSGLTGTLKFISACALAGLVCWIEPAVIQSVCLLAAIVALMWLWH
jgi:hypothetical protein